MELQNLRPAKGAVKSEKRVGRGQGAGTGGTSTRGHKGAKSRSGYSSKRAFEGGQMPLQMRLPKRGFKNINRVDYVGINVSRLQEISEKFNLTDISDASLAEARIVKKTDKVKVLGNGDITAKLNISTSAISNSAKAKIEAAGGSVNID
ncbi:MAG: 50S ribosomal protein L15 [Saprospiraceae bacterium]|nr:50S ribosomal protein L15 [Saprospiraceae bacterium]